ncbi:MAG: septum formation family protein [Propionicimonas sp.]
MSVRAGVCAMAVLALLTGCTGGIALPFPAPDRTPLFASPAPPPTVLLRVGDCTGPVESGVGPYDQLPGAACDRPHYYEVVGLIPLAGAQWPGFDAVSSAAERACPDAFTSYVGVAAGSSLYTTGGVVPAQTDWLSPDNRLVVCLAGTDGGGLVGSVKGDTRQLPSKGQCIGSIRGDRLSLIECSRRHSYEVFAERALTASESNAKQDRFCRERFESFVGVPAARSRYFLGDLGAMASLSRLDPRLVCVAGPVDAAGSIRGAKK